MRQYAFALIILMAICGTADAGPVTYAWGPLSGGGTYSTTGVPPYLSYTTTSGYLDITYDPEDPSGDLVLGYVGDPVDRTFAATVGHGFGISLSGGYLSFSGISGLSIIDVTLAGDPGPLTPGGLPTSLDGFLGEPASVHASVGSRFGPGFNFVGTAADAGIVPEPSGLLPMAMATLAAFAAAWRGGRR